MASHNTFVLLKFLYHAKISVSIYVHACNTFENARCVGARVRISPISPTEGFRKLIIDFRVHASRFVGAHNISRAPYLACRSTCKRPVRPLRAYTRGRVEPRAKRRRFDAKLAWVAFNERDSIVSATLSLSLSFFLYLMPAVLLFPL